MDGFLDERMEILDAHAETIEAELAKSGEMIAGGDARVDFNADFSVGSEGEVIARVAEEIFDLRRSEIGGRAAAPVELRDGAIFGDGLADAVDFALQDFEIRRSDTLIFLDDDVAGAEKAEAFAKGKVHVERDGRFCSLGFCVNFFEVVRAEGIVPDGSGRIAGVARARTIVTSEKVFADAKLFAHVLQSWICESHAKYSLFLLVPSRGRLRFLQKSLLAGFDEELRVGDGCLLKNAVAEIEDVACAAESGDGVLRCAANLFGRAKKDGGIDVALKGDARAERFAEGAQVDAPIDAEDLGAGTGDSWEKMMGGFGVVNNGGL